MTNYVIFPPLIEIFTSTLLPLLPVSMGYPVTTKPGQSKYIAGPSRDRSVLKTKLLTGERKWTHAMFRMCDINNGAPACAHPTERPDWTTRGVESLAKEDYKISKKSPQTNVTLPISCAHKPFLKNQIPAIICLHWLLNECCFKSLLSARENNTAGFNSILRCCFHHCCCYYCSRLAPSHPLFVIPQYTLACGTVSLERHLEQVYYYCCCCNSCCRCYQCKKTKAKKQTNSIHTWLPVDQSYLAACRFLCQF